MIFAKKTEQQIATFRLQSTPLKGDDLFQAVAED
jgi:hypothetical protein